MHFACQAVTSPARGWELRGAAGVAEPLGALCRLGLPRLAVGDEVLPRPRVRVQVALPPVIARNDDGAETLVGENRGDLVEAAEVHGVVGHALHCFTSRASAAQRAQSHGRRPPALREASRAVQSVRTRLDVSWATWKRSASGTAMARDGERRAST